MKKSILVLLNLFVLCLEQNIYAQTDNKNTLFVRDTSKGKYEKLVNLEPVVISANHQLVSRRQAPSMVSVVNEKVLKMSNSVCVGDALDYQSGIRVEDGCASCGTKSARIGGLDGHYTQILINSRPLLSSVGAFFGLEQIPANMIERIELMRGGSSALYGAGCIGGTINIITKEPIENSAYLSHSLMSIGMTDAMDRVTSMNSSIVSQDRKSGVSIFFQDRKRDGYSYYDDGYTTLPRLKVLNAGVNAFLKTGAFSKLTLSYFITSDDRRGGNKLDMPVEQSNLTELNDHLIHNINLNYHWNSSDNRWHADLFSSFGAVSRKSYAGGYVSETDPDTNVYKYHTLTKDITFNIGGLLRYRFEKLWFLPAYLTIGGEYTGDKLKDEALYYDIVNRQTVNIESFYIQNEWTDKKWNILIGIRADKHNLIDDIIFSPRLNFKFSPLDNMDLRLCYSEGFRSPQVYDEDLHVSMAGGERYISHFAKNLKEERSRTASAGIDYYLNISKTKMNLMVEGFYTALTDVFATRVINSTTIGGENIIEKYNGDGAKYYGINAEWKGFYSRYLQSSIGFTFQKSKYDEALQWSDNVPSSRIILRSPDSYGYMTLSYLPNNHWDIDFTGTYTGRMYVGHVASSFSNSDYVKHTSSFWDLNLKITYNLLLLKSCRMDFSVGMMNILDSFQKDLDRGADRDSDYIYGPSLRRSLIFSFGVKI